MKPDDKTIEKFHQAYKEKFGEEISTQETLERFTRLVNVLRVIVRPEPLKRVKLSSVVENKIF